MGIIRCKQGSALKAMAGDGGTYRRLLGGWFAAILQFIQLLPQLKERLCLRLFPVGDHVQAKRW